MARGSDSLEYLLVVWQQLSPNTARKHHKHIIFTLFCMDLHKGDMAC